MGPEREAAIGWTSRGRRDRVGRAGRAGATMCVLLVVGALCGCAGAHASSTGAAAVSEAPGHTFATAVNLRVTDLPGAEAVARESAGPSPSTAALAFARCDGGVSPKRIVQEARSTLLSARRGSLLVRSRVTLWPSEALASHNLAAFAGKRGSRCALRYGATSVPRLTVALAGGARALGLRFVVRSHGKHTGKVNYHDIIGFVRGPAEIVLTAAWLSRRVEPRTEQRLIEALYRRASDVRSGA
jgi:hypothetical protein